MNRSTRSIALVMAAPALLALAAACSKGNNDNAGAASDTTATVAAPNSASTAMAPAAAPESAGAAAAPAGAPNDAQIAAIAVAANSTDSASGEMAKQKATNPKVKEFAQRMITDHGGVNKQAVALAGKLHLTPEANPTSQQLTQGGEQSRQQLGGLSGAAFDRGYIDHEVEYHQTVLQALDQTLIPNAKNGELKALLQQVRPAVAAHLKMAQDIQKSLGG